MKSEDKYKNKRSVNLEQLLKKIGNDKTENCPTADILYRYHTNCMHQILDFPNLDFQLH